MVVDVCRCVWKWGGEERGEGGGERGEQERGERESPRQICRHMHMNVDCITLHMKRRACTNVHTQACTVFTHACVHTHTCVRTHAHVVVHTHAGTDAHDGEKNKCICWSAYEQVRMYVCMLICACTYMRTPFLSSTCACRRPCVRTCTYIPANVCVCVCAYMHNHIYNDTSTLFDEVPSCQWAHRASATIQTPCPRSAFQ